MNNTMDFSRMQQQAGEAVGLLKALGNPHRLMLLCVLQEKEMTVGEINQRVPISQSSLSQHLAWLRQRDFVSCRRQGQHIYYRLSKEEVRAVIALLYQLYCRE